MLLAEVNPLIGPSHLPQVPDLVAFVLPLVPLQAFAADVLVAQFTVSFGLLVPVANAALVRDILFFAQRALKLGMNLLHPIDKESWREAVHTAWREGGALAAFWAGEWPADASSDSQIIDALFAVVV